ncbi:MAG: DUF2062 domain-containing protein [Gammaproteobacteria bacterium]
MKIRNHKLVRLITALLGEGITPHKIALTVALGVMLGVTPVLGTTTILCAIAALALRMNLPLIQVVNYLVYPFQLLLLIPFIQAGQWLFRQPPLPFSFSQLTALLHENFWHTLNMLWGYTLHGLVAWLILGGITAILIYMLLRPLLGILLARKTAVGKPGIKES